jgi:hypothetical protein
LIKEQEDGRRLAENAWADFLANWTWDAIAPKIWATAEDCLRRNATLA